MAGWLSHSDDPVNAACRERFPLRALLIDDHALFRQGLKYLLADLDDAMVFCDADSCAEALPYASATIDLVLLDLHMPGGDGMDALTRIRGAFDASIVVVLSSEDDPRVIRQAIELGASGFIPKASTPQLMIAALRLVLAGGTYLPPHVLRDVAPAPRIAPQQISQPLSRQHSRFAPELESELESGQAPSGRCPEGLSERQLEVLMKVVQGKANKVIARELELSEGTVKAHLSAAFRALGVRNRTEAVYMAARTGLTQGPAPASQPPLARG